MTSDDDSESKTCRACDGDVDEDDCSYIGVGTPIAKALGIDDLSAEGPFIVGEECYEEALDYVTSGEFQKNGYEPMPKHR